MIFKIDIFTSYKFLYKHKGRITIPVSFLNIHFFNFEDGLSIYLMDFFFFFFICITGKHRDLFFILLRNLTLIA